MFKSNKPMNIFIVLFVVAIFAACNKDASAQELPECSTVPHYFSGFGITRVGSQSTMNTYSITSPIHNNKAACEKALSEQIALPGAHGVGGIVNTATIYNGVCHATKECFVPGQ